MTQTLPELEAALQQVTERGEESPAKVDLLIELVKALRTNEPERILHLSRDACRLARRLSYRKGEAYGIGYMGFAFYLLSNHEAARSKFLEAIALFEEAGDLGGQALCLSGLASVQMSLGEFEQALASGLGALKIFRRTGNRYEEAWTLTGFGNGYTDWGDYDRALPYHQQALDIFVDIGEKIGEARALTGIGTICQKKGDYEQALPYHRKSLQIFEETGNRIGEARALNDLGTIYHHLGDYEQALRYHHQSLAIREEVGNRQSQSTSLINLGHVYLSQKDAPKALDVLHRALAIAEDVKATPRVYQAHQVLAEAYEQSGDLAKALEHHKAFDRVKEDVLGEQAQVAISNLRVGYEVEKAEQKAEIERLKNVELKAKNDELARLLEELKTAQTQLVQAEKLASLGQLTAGIAHEIKNPLNFVNNFAQLSAELTDELDEELVANKDKPVGEVLDALEDLLDDLRFNARKIREHGQRADGIVQSMLLHSRGDPGAIRPTDINALLDEYVNLAYHGMRAHNPAFNVTIERDFDEALGTVDVVPQELGRVFLNLLNNAFYAVLQSQKHAERAPTAAGETRAGAYAPTVTVATGRSAESVFIRVSDNGPGISPEERDKIFEPFFTTKPTGEGTGLGLSLSYDIITQAHSGTLTVESTEGKGATFIITLPT